MSPGYDLSVVSKGDLAAAPSSSEAEGRRVLGNVEGLALAEITVFLEVIMRTTIRLPDDLLTEAKRVAAETNRSLTRLIEDALRSALARRQAPPRERVRLPTVDGMGLRPGVDLDNSAALLDIMEGLDDPA